MDNGFPRYPWLPRGARSLGIGDPLPVAGGRYFVLAVATLVLLGNPVLLPWWAVLAVLAGLALLTTVTVACSRAPQYPTMWLVTEPERIGVVHAGNPGDPEPGTVTWLARAETSLRQGSWAGAAEEAYGRYLDAAGAAPTEQVPDPGEEEDEDEAPALPGYVLWDSRGAAVVHHHQADSAAVRSLFDELDVLRDQLPAPRRTPLATRVNFDDARALVRVGAAPAHRVEAAFGGYARQTEIDVLLDLGLPRGFPSVLDTLPPAEVRALPVADRLAVLREEVVVQGGRDLAWERARGTGAPISPEWTEQWLARLDALGAAPGTAPALVPGAWPEVGVTARVALLVLASGTDLSARPVRAELESLGIPGEAATERLSWGPRRGLWLAVDKVVLGGCYLAGITAVAVFVHWLGS
ncbi:hypothetical protein JOF53_002442 [Crossiella equi]|uniref:Uncharacterized protein n=1 Tax=Crossiella equi TaxID=130796 RepID=A0ABS5AAG1_9PSEU|nr:hypothetical protein [Crossiella equi]MBP2473570.1 hypothetical protein [Crossiella equi]